jgi:hypothetical protein
MILMEKKFLLELIFGAISFHQFAILSSYGQHAKTSLITQTERQLLNKFAKKQ